MGSRLATRAAHAPRSYSLDQPASAKRRPLAVMAQLLRPEDDAFLKIDCSLFSQGHEVSALVGAPPSYVGRDQKPLLNPDIIEQDNSVILFDEIEKGQPELWNLLLQIMEDGEILLLNGGRRVSFHNQHRHPDDQRRRQRDGRLPRPPHDRLSHRAQGCRGHRPADLPDRVRGAPAGLPARVDQPHRRDYRLPPAFQRDIARGARPHAERGQRSVSPAWHPRRSHPSRQRVCAAQGL